ncbi:IorA3 [Desulforapulum autotrophicum HRM2]|uniref:Indolepyruvate oxidoreductase subunit IorA n=1 Tax=Desulforapulum autotrophicum (strain ATCC 43914 / DSM 3382 / VKM B-1955 / HRM2) TaxID=177437 RepID=C0QMA9_DESAH|nr:thiamine pyrophosphate-dependent enzyme [Desulforapulum autotrophicum]ACN16426.1 IorA3 [Desulforapulum autotrophicum HRM2]
MSLLTRDNPGETHLMMGNEAIVRGALEAGISVAAGYPGTPSSEIIETLAKISTDIYTEWSVNEKVALEVAAAASFAGLRSLAVMKQPGVNVAADFLMHLALSGVRGGMVLLVADDPGALSSINEGESRLYAKLMEIPMLEPGNFQEAKDMTRWAFELSESLNMLVMVRTVTRLSHASGNVTLGDLPNPKREAFFRFDGDMLDPMEGPIMTPPVAFKHRAQQRKLELAAEHFETSPYNTYVGPESPELLIITTSICDLYSREVVNLLDIGTRVGIFKIGTTWPLPEKCVTERLAKTKQILFVEEVQPFIEEAVKVLAAGSDLDLSAITFYGKYSRHIPLTGEMNPEFVTQALCTILDLPLPASHDKNSRLAMPEISIPPREISFCPGCPHRASFFSINTVLSLDSRQGFTCGDIGCYSMGMLPGGFFTLKTLHSMGSGSGLASGFGKLRQFGMKQPVVAVCGDSTFFHSAMPPLVNAIHNSACFTLIILDNSGTAMTGFQPHPGLPVDTCGKPAPPMDIEGICRAMGATTRVCDPFDLKATQQQLLEFIKDDTGVNVLILRQACALSPQKRHTRAFEVTVDPALCIGERCGCNRICTRVFSCPGLIWDAENNRAAINSVLCAGCGVCAAICPQNAIQKKEIQ